MHKHYNIIIAEMAKFNTTIFIDKIECRVCLSQYKVLLMLDHVVMVVNSAWMAWKFSAILRDEVYHSVETGTLINITVTVLSVYSMNTRPAKNG